MLSFRLLLSLFVSLLWSASAWMPAMSRVTRRAASTATSSTSLAMAIDYNDPVVAAEFAAVQPMTFEEVEEELMEKGIPVSQAMNEVNAKLMLVEMRLRLSGQLAGNKKQQRPTKFSSKLDEAIWTKVAFAEFYNDLKAKGDNNALNVVAEYINNKTTALQRYGKDYKALIRKTEAALAAPPPVKSNTLAFSGCK
jgi:hypothetical protein